MALRSQRISITRFALLPAMFAVAAANSAMSARAFADTVALSSIKDNTIIQDVNGNSSNALGDAIYSGRTGTMGGQRRLRAVAMFNLAPIPAGATVNAVTLRLNLIQTDSNNHSHTIHKMLGNWGEGTSQAGGGLGSDATPGDVTWLHAYFPNSFWTTPGGDHDGAVLATTTVGSVYTAYTWSAPAMAALVQGWVDNPASNFGLMVKGNESITHTAKKFASREHETVLLRPVLIVDYTPPGTKKCPADIVKDGVVNVNDLLAVINNWGRCAQPCPPSCAADVSPAIGDCTVNVNDLLAVIDHWGPCG